MRSTVMYGAHDVRVEVVPDATLVERTHALVGDGGGVAVLTVPRPYTR